MCYVEISSLVCLMVGAKPSLSTAQITNAGTFPGSRLGGFVEYIEFANNINTLIYALLYEYEGNGHEYNHFGHF